MSYIAENASFYYQHWKQKLMAGSTVCDLWPYTWHAHTMHKKESSKLGRFDTIYFSLFHFTTACAVTQSTLHWDMPVITGVVWGSMLPYLMFYLNNVVLILSKCWWEQGQIKVQFVLTTVQTRSSICFICLFWREMAKKKKKKRKERCNS